LIYELVPQPDTGYASVRLNGITVAKIDLMLLHSLPRWTPPHGGWTCPLAQPASDGPLLEIPFLEAVAERPKRKP
jgi:hypothetical protein